MIILVIAVGVVTMHSIAELTLLTWSYSLMACIGYFNASN